MKKITAFVAILLCSACGTISSNVNSYTSPAFNPQAVHVVVARDQAQQNDLEFAEYSMQATRAVMEAGIYVDNANRNPQVAIMLDYGIGEPEVSMTTTSEPIMGRIKSKDKGRGKDKRKQTYGVVGYRDVPVTVTNYSKYMSLTAVDFAGLRAGQARQIWRVDIRATDERRDLRVMMPFMLSAAVPYMGRSSGYEQLSRVVINDERANYILTGIRNQAPLTQ